jgi:hypothetical protein
MNLFPRDAEAARGEGARLQGIRWLAQRCWAGFISHSGLPTGPSVRMNPSPALPRAARLWVGRQCSVDGGIRFSLLIYSQRDAA